MRKIETKNGIQPAVVNELITRDKAMAGDMVLVVTPATASQVPTEEGWTKDFLIEVKTAAGEVHDWLTKDFTTGVSVADTSSAGEATIASTTLSIENGKAVVTVTGDEAAWLGGTAQVETITATAGASSAGNVTMTITAAGMSNSPKAVTIALTTDDDTAAEVAAKVRAALEADEDVNAFFTVGGTGAAVVITAKTPAANDATMAFGYVDTGSTSATFGSSTNTTAGVAKETATLTVAEMSIMGYTLASKTGVVTIEAE